MDWQTIIYFMIGLLIGVVFHEYMHGQIAYRLGDTTPKTAGRLTLNPIPHIDPFGTLILPLAMIILRLPFLFGYAKPVPINPFFLKKAKRDMMLIALAGPLTNFTIGFAVALIGMIIRLIGVTPTGNWAELFELLFRIAEINIILGFFNLIPVPPLDGSHIVSFFLPPRLERQYEAIAPYGFILIIAFLWIFGDTFFGWMSPIMDLVLRIMVG